MKDLEVGFPMKRALCQSSRELDKLVPIRSALCSALHQPRWSRLLGAVFHASATVPDAGSSCVAGLIPTY